MTAPSNSALLTDAFSSLRCACGYGPEYAAFSDQGLDGGFFRSDLAASAGKGSALIVFYSERLEETQSKIERAGGQVVKPIFKFPGGRRFHFVEPSGNEFAVWSESGA